MKTACVLSLITLLCAQTAPALEEKAGYQVTVSKVTLSRNDTRYSIYYSSTRLNRLQGLKVNVRSSTVREQPPADVEWAILVMKVSGGSPELLTGTEKLKALKAAESTELILGSAQIFGWFDAAERTRDKLEWQVVIKRDGKELLRSASMPNFDAVASVATKVTSKQPPLPAGKK